ncbi:MAG: hypothetical protein Q4B90_09055 [Eubacteriales bacterium]|nr:hypothetical protein [Eubacteriales bacterium]
MTTILKSIHKAEEKFDRRAEGFAFHHPLLAFFAMFVGMPFLILSLVLISTIVVVLPFTFLFGWL